MRGELTGDLNKAMITGITPAYAGRTLNENAPVFNG